MKLGAFDVSGHYTGDCREMLQRLPDACVQTCITSPPYWGLRDYGVEGQIGLESRPEDYVSDLVSVFREVRRVLRDNGTLWLNLGDSYAHGGCGARDAERWPKQARNEHMPRHEKKMDGKHQARGAGPMPKERIAAPGFKPKDLVGIPWMVAFGLRADGWYLRADIIWHKPNPMPESVTDRPTKSHEYIFLLSKREHYYYDAEAIAEPTSWAGQNRSSRDPEPSSMPGAPAHRGLRKDKQRAVGKRTYVGFNDRWDASEANGTAPTTRNKRSVWTVGLQPYGGAHFATYPPALIEPCVLAGAPVGGVVLDPFFGSGTTGEVAEKHGRLWLGFDINPAYEALQKERTAQRSLLSRMEPAG